MGPTLLVATVGGHVDELFDLAPRYAPSFSDRVWVTARSAQTEHLLQGERVEWVPPITSRQWMRAIRAFPHAWQVIGRLKPGQMVSTGAAVAVPYAIAARLRGVPVLYIESATRLDGPSLSGRILEWLPGVRLARQCSGWTRRRWSEVPSVFDGYEAVEEDRPSSGPLSVVVTFGTGPFEFTRAANALVEALPASARVVWQRGATPADASWPGQVDEWLSYGDLRKAMEDSDVVVTHAGVGSILTAFRAGRRPVVLSRRADVGEVVDNHQAHLASDLAERGLVVDGDLASTTLADQLLDARAWGVRRVDEPGRVGDRAG